MSHPVLKAVPLCVDLDGTLLKTDLLFESLARLLKQKPWLLPLIPIWFLQGKAALKKNIARRISIQVASLPYNLDLLNWLREQKTAGRQLLLVTAADESQARQVADHLGIFDRVWASDGRVNLKGKRKLRFLREQITGDFEYAGNCRADLEVWRHCAAAVVVDAPASVLKQVRTHVPKVVAFERPSHRWRPYLRALRLHQWVKNILIYVPLVTSHEFTHPILVLRATLAVFLFSLCASAQYILNDLLDLESDRQHKSKRNRPFTSGAIPLEAAFCLAPILLIVSLAGALFLSKAFAALLGIYFVVALSYSMYLKRVILLDAFLLSGLYTLRIVAGHLVTGIVFSVWLLSFAFFLFLSLAFSKRWAELNNSPPSGPLEGRGYQIGDLGQINLFGVCSAFLSAVVFILYLQSDKVKELYRQPQLLWLLSPIFLYWISRIWILSSRGEVSEDPILFVVKDRVSYMVAAISGLIMMAASAGWFHAGWLHAG